ncbi:MAG TPA: class A beta-lactamase-related serine hydrolase [Elusimicrobiota bacterium]|nr:class A beta-lactamase-related serine hydrolase [Elusimicrobiota bacterium]
MKYRAGLLWVGLSLFPVLLQAGEVRQGGYHFINPLLECETEDWKEIRSFKRELEELIDKEKKRTTISHVSVYFRDLKNGPWFGIQERDPFAPASLLKVPLMMAYYRLAQDRPALLNEKVVFQRKKNVVARPGVVLPLVDGQIYSIEDLINTMIIHSDNEAKDILFDNIPLKEDLIRVYTDLDIVVPYQSMAEDHMSVKSYTGFFRVLFNASYLNREYSERALYLLSKTTFRGGLVAGVPPGVIVSHKWGFWPTKTGGKQLHDCGIIYYQEHPYLLGVMTRGKTEEELVEIVRKISQFVYDELNRQYIGKKP